MFLAVPGLECGSGPASTSPCVLSSLFQNWVCADELLELAFLLPAQLGLLHLSCWVFGAVTYILDSRLGTWHEQGC